MLSAYRKSAAEREAQGIPALPLNREQVEAITKLLENPPSHEKEQLLNLLRHRVPPGVDEAAHVKANWLRSIANNKAKSPLVSPIEATKLLGNMIGGYNVEALIEILESDNLALAECAAKGLSHTLLVYDAVNDVIELAKNNSFAAQVIDSWANASWFTSKKILPVKI